MATPNPERVTCPACNKAYRWQSALAGRSIACKACGKDFVIPDRPGVGLAVEPEPVDEPVEEDAGLYELASDPDDEPDLPPARPTPTAAPSRAEPAPVAATPPPPASLPPESLASPSLADAGDSDPNHAEEPAYVSDEIKAARREAQRIAAAENEPVRSWRDYKGLITVAGVVGLFVVIYLAMLLFSDALE